MKYAVVSESHHQADSERDDDQGSLCAVSSLDAGGIARQCSGSLSQPRLPDVRSPAAGGAAATNCPLTASVGAAEHVPHASAATGTPPAGRTAASAPALVVATPGLAPAHTAAGTEPVSASHTPAPHGGDAAGGDGGSVAGKQGRDSSMVSPPLVLSPSARADVPKLAVNAAAKGDENPAQDTAPTPVSPTADAAAAAESLAAQSRAPASEAAAVESAAENAPLEVVPDRTTAPPPSISDRPDASGLPSSAADPA